MLCKTQIYWIFAILSVWTATNNYEIAQNGLNLTLERRLTERRLISRSESEIAARAAIIDKFFAERNLPLAGYGAKFIQAADHYGIDWRLLPAIAIRESSGGKEMCGNNPFGWASCRKDFESVDEAIDYVAWNLGGHNPLTAAYYSVDTRAKLYFYNGTVVPTYPEEVIRIMEHITNKLPI